MQTRIIIVLIIVTTQAEKIFTGFRDNNNETRECENCKDTQNSTYERESRFFPNFLPRIRFQNKNCITVFNETGVCYAEPECSTKGGLAHGSCASGFGVCCKFSPSCGDTTAENVTYISTLGATVDNSYCRYTVCKFSSDVTMLRLDFSEFQISPPFWCGASTESVVCTGTDGPRIGDCIYDSFVVTTPGFAAPPVICGYNSGQHMYVPASPRCNQLVFNFDLQVNTARLWNIKVSQISSSDGTNPPPGCLQYFTGTEGSVANFNFKNRQTSYHLSSQRYQICWRRERGYCSICYAVVNLAYGLSNVPSKAPSSGSSSWNKKAGFTDSICCSKDSPTANCGTSGANDFVEIDNAIVSPTKKPDRFTVGNANRFCGRFFTSGSSSVQYSAAAQKTVCTSTIPFRMRVSFSDGEVLNPANTCKIGRKAGPSTLDTSDECSTHPRYGSFRGTLGFKFGWKQTSC